LQFPLNNQNSHTKLSHNAAKNTHTKVNFPCLKVSFEISIDFMSLSLTKTPFNSKRGSQPTLPSKISVKLVLQIPKGLGMIIEELRVLRHIWINTFPKNLNLAEPHFYSMGACNARGHCFPLSNYFYSTFSEV